MTEIEQLIQQAIIFFREGTKARWSFAEAAEQIVGKYERGATLDLASRCGISVSQVENYGRAGLIWKAATTTYPESVKQLNKMRDVLPISHWTALADAWKTLEFELWEGLSLLEEIAMEDKIITVMEFKSLLQGKFGNGGTPEWESKWQAAQSKLRSMLQDYGVPDEIRDKVNILLCDDPHSWVLVLEGEKPISWNTIWSSPHWTERTKLADEVRVIVRKALDPEVEPPPLPVDITFIAYQPNLTKKGKTIPLVDCDNLCVKPYLDGLKDWWLKDDSPEYVRSVRLYSMVDNTNPRLEIILTPVPGAKAWQVDEPKGEEEL